MDVREKLVELIESARYWGSGTSEEIADHLIDAVCDYMVQKLLGGFDCNKAISSGYEWALKDGRVVELRVTIKQPGKKNDNVESISRLMRSGR